MFDQPFSLKTEVKTRTAPDKAHMRTAYEFSTVTNSKQAKWAMKECTNSFHSYEIKNDKHWKQYDAE